MNTNETTHAKAVSSERLLSALVAFAEGEAYCPCCEGIRECKPECTIEADCKRGGGDAWTHYERMMAARKALNTDTTIRDGGNAAPDSK